jgi:serine phosphatase RsbU (regulator of sigma subunit)/PAS domain-containing protein
VSPLQMPPGTSPAKPAIGAEQALEFVARASVLLARSLDYETTLRQVAQLAVPEIADWCGVLLVEPDGEERELSSGHADPELDAVLREIRARRRATAGASESRRVAQTGEPILGADVRSSIGTDVDEGQRKLVDRLAPKSYLIVPLPARGRILGSMTLLSTREGRFYGPSDVAFAAALAERCALAIDNARLHDSAERSLSVLHTVFSSAPVGLALVDRDLSLVRVNETFAAFDAGASHRELAVAYRHVLDTGEAVLDRDLSTASPDGQRRHWNASFTPVPHADGSITSVIVTVVDVTERRALLDAEREARSRADFLARAGAILDASLDYEETLRSVAQIAVPEIADWCAVSVLDDAGVLEEVATAHVDSAKREVARELRRRFPPDPNATTGAVAVARTGQTQYFREITDEILEAAISDHEQLAIVRRLGVRSAVVAALRARGRRFGTLTLASAESGRLFEDADVQLAEELAARAGMAIDNARLYTERTRIAHTLQARLLPERLPDIPDVVVAARYRAAGELNEVGGDFYDVFPRSSTEWALVVGDVSGKGAEAASVTALARYTLRAAALESARPSDALRRLNTAVLDDDTSQFATAALAYFAKAGPDGLDVRLSLAGHPAPAIVRRDGAVESAGRFGMMVGLREDPVLHDAELRIGPGDVLLLYTDGASEAGPRGQPLGEPGIAAVLGELAGQPPQAIVDAIERAAVAAQPGDPRDDIALLAIAIRYPVPNAGPRAPVHSRARRTNASTCLTSPALTGLSLHQVRRPRAKSTVPTNGSPSVEVTRPFVALATAASHE